MAVQTVLITGGTGYFAWSLVELLLKEKNTKIFVMSSNKALAERRFAGTSVICVDNEDFLQGRFRLREIQTIVHTAFCRKSDGGLLVDSLIFMQKLIKAAIRDGVSGFINLSSQSVYGSLPGPRPDEEGQLHPEYLYALAKCSSELLLESLVSPEETMAYCNIRLASLVGPGITIPENVLYKFICSGLEGRKFRVIGGKQNFSFLDVRDAAKAITLLIRKSESNWKKVYNLGPEKQTDMLFMADTVCEKIYELTGKRIEYDFQPDDTQLNSGMNSAMLYRELNWKPEFTFDQTVMDTARIVQNRIH